MRKLLLNMLLGRSLSMFFFIYFLTIIIGGLSGATIIVPPGGNIQNAINSANDGDTIQLLPGIYIQEFQIVSKNLNIIGAGRDSTFIQAPPSSAHLTQNFSYGGSSWWCIVLVDNQSAPTSQTVNISHLTVDGDQQQDTTIPPTYGNSDRFFAIGYHNANGIIQHVHTTNTKQSANFNELAGGGIVNASDSGSVNFTVDNCLIDFYQRIGIDCRGSALTADISNNTVERGYVLAPNTSTATPNGIQFTGFTRGNIMNNMVSENIATVLNASATGIILVDTGSNAMVSNNFLRDNDNGIVAISCDDGLMICNNSLYFSTTPGVNPDEGIIVQDTNGLTTITSNIMNDIPDVNMELISSTNQPFQLMNNQFIGSQTGLIVTGNGTVGPIVTMDSDSFIGTIGYYIQEVAAPNNIWPSTATVSFDGLISGHMTFAQFNQVLNKIYDKHNDPALGLVLDFISPVPPSVSSISPSFGSVNGGTPVTIMGFNFISSDTQVFFGTSSALDVVVVSNTIITAIAPPGTGIVDVTVVTSFGTSPITDGDQYTYIPSPLITPQVTNISPNFGTSAGGNTVLITGSGFSSNNTQVLFGTIPALRVIVLSDTSIEAIAPPGSGTVDIFVMTPNGISPSNPSDKYTYLSSPTPPFPPFHFIGVIRKNEFVDQIDYVLKATWDASPSSDVVRYQIYKGNRLVEEISADSSMHFSKHSGSKRSLTRYKIVAVNADGLKSRAVKIRIIKR